MSLHVAARAIKDFYKADVIFGRGLDIEFRFLNVFWKIFLKISIHTLFFDIARTNELISSLTQLVKHVELVIFVL